jgi:hypothetical protein
VGQPGSPCGSDFATVNVIITQGVATSITYDSPYCVSVSAPQLPQLTGVAGGEFDASPNGLSMNAAGAIVPALSAPGIYLVTYTPAAGTSCNAQATATVVIEALPVATISTSGSTVLCPESVVTLSAPSGYTYLWSNGLTSQSIAVDMPGAYSVTIETASGCAATSSITNVTNANATTPTITANGPTSFCEGSSVQLTSSAGSSFNWSNGAVSQSIQVFATGEYFVTVTNAAGCALQSNTIQVEVTSTVDASITASGSTSFCEGENVTLTASPGASYVWSNGATSPSIVVNTTGNYFVTVSESNGCSGTSQAVQVSVTGYPNAFITTSGSTSFCAGGSVTLTASTASAYAWSNGATTQSITVDEGGSYSVTTIAGGICENTSNSIDIEVVAFYTFYVDADMDGFGDSDQQITGCDIQLGQSFNPGDCDDSIAAINPQADELCDDIDNNCDGVTDEFCGADVFGCTDAGACNFNVNATVDDGSCTYPGCTYVDACNYDAGAGCDNGQCTFGGCNDPLALNFDAEAGCDDGSCLYAEGCTDVLACNYDAVAVVDDGSCIYPGCTDSEACNYDVNAGCDDGSCLPAGCMDVDACNYDASAMCDDASCTYMGGEIEGPQIVPVGSTTTYTFPCDGGCEYVWTVNYLSGTETLSGFAMDPSDSCTVEIAWNVLPGVTDIRIDVHCDNGCTASDIIYVQLSSLTELEGVTIELYPNPTLGRSVLRIPESMIGSSLHVYNSLGEWVSEEVLFARNTAIDATRWAAGVYTLMMKDENGRVATIRMVKE